MLTVRLTAHNGMLPLFGDADNLNSPRYRLSHVAISLHQRRTYWSLLTLYALGPPRRWEVYALVSFPMKRRFLSPTAGDCMPLRGPTTLPMKAKILVAKVKHRRVPMQANLHLKGYTSSSHSNTLAILIPNEVYTTLVYTFPIWVRPLPPPPVF